MNDLNSLSNVNPLTQMLIPCSICCDKNFQKISDRLWVYFNIFTALRFIFWFENLDKALLQTLCYLPLHPHDLFYVLSMKTSKWMPCYKHRIGISWYHYESFYDLTKLMISWMLYCTHYIGIAFYYHELIYVLSMNTFY